MNKKEIIMGSFDYTCAISELAISAGDECRIITLVPRSLNLNAGACSKMEILFPAVKGVYDDYGFIEKVKPTKFQELMAKNKGYKSVDDFFENLIKGLVSSDNGHRITGNDSNKNSTCFSLVREDVWQAMLSIPSKLSYKSYEDQDADVLIGKACQEGVVFFEQLKKKIDQNSDDSIKRLQEKLSGDGSDYSNFSQVKAIASGVGVSSSFSSFKSVFGYYITGDDSIFKEENILALITMMKLSQATDFEIKETLHELGEQILINKNMHTLRKVWLHRESSGPQSGEDVIHWLWSQKIAEIAIAKVNWDDEDSGEYYTGFKEAKSLMLQKELKETLPKGVEKKGIKGL